MSLNRMNVVVLAALVGLTLGLVPYAQAQIQEVKVEIKGLSCPFCVKGVEKHLKKVKGVQDVSTSLKKGEVTLHYVPGASFDVVSLQNAVTRSGFTAGPVQVTARGEISRHEEDFLFNVAGSETSFLIHEKQSPEEQGREAIVSTETKDKLEQAITANQTLEIIGQVHAHKDALPGLSVERVTSVRVNEQKIE